MTNVRLRVVQRYAYALGARSGYAAHIVGGRWIPWAVPQPSVGREAIDRFRANLGGWSGLPARPL